MQTLLHKIYWTLCRWLLALRYRVRVTGLDKLRSLKGPTLVMPNHPGYVDPAIVLAHVRLKQRLRPIVYEDTYRYPLFYPLMLLAACLRGSQLEQGQPAVAAEGDRDARCGRGGLESGRLAVALSFRKAHADGDRSGGIRPGGCRPPAAMSAGQYRARPHHRPVGQHVRLCADRQRTRSDENAASRPPAGCWRASFSSCRGGAWK